MRSTTKAYGINGSLAAGIDGSLSAGVTYDNLGNLGVIVTRCYGGGSPNASVSLFKTVTTAPQIYDQRGSSVQIGGSVDVYGVSVGAEYLNFEDEFSKTMYHGCTSLIGLGAPIPAELHGEIGQSYVYGINVYDVMEGIYVKIMEW